MDTDFDDQIPTYVFRVFINYNITFRKLSYQVKYFNILKKSFDNADPS